MWIFAYSVYVVETVHGLPTHRMSAHFRMDPHPNPAPPPAQNKYSECSICPYLESLIIPYVRN